MEKGPSAEIRGEFVRANLLVHLCGDFWVDLFGPFSLKKVGGKNLPKKSRVNSDLNLGASRPKSTLQGSGPDNFGANPFL